MAEVKRTTLGLRILVTGNTSLTGDLSTKTLSDTVNVTTSGQHTDFGAFKANNPPILQQWRCPEHPLSSLSRAAYSLTPTTGAEPGELDVSQNGKRRDDNAVGGCRPGALVRLERPPWKLRLANNGALYQCH